MQEHLSALWTSREHLTLSDAWRCVRDTAVVTRRRDLPLTAVIAELAAPFPAATGTA